MTSSSWAYRTPLIARWLFPRAWRSWIYGVSSGEILRSRAAFFFLLLFVIFCIVLDGLQQVWIEWKRLIWGELGMRVIEKIRLTFGRAVSR